MDFSSIVTGLLVLVVILYLLSKPRILSNATRRYDNWLSKQIARTMAMLTRVAFVAVIALLLWVVAAIVG